MKYNMHYIIKNKQRKQEVPYLKDMQKGVVRLGLGWQLALVTDESTCHFMYVLFKVPQRLHIMQTQFSKLSVLPTPLFKSSGFLFIGLYMFSKSQ